MAGRLKPGGMVLDDRSLEALDLSLFELTSAAGQAGLLSLHQRLLPVSLIVCDLSGRVIFGHVMLRAQKDKGIPCRRCTVQVIEVSEAEAWLLSYRMLDAFQMAGLYEQLNLWLHLAEMLSLDELRRLAVLPFGLSESIQSRLPNLFCSPLAANLERDELVWQVLFRLLERDQSEWPAWSRLFALAHFSRSRQIAVVEALEEIVFRDKCPLMQVVGALEEQTSPGAERAEAVWRWIHGRRYPQVTAMEETWRSQVALLGLPAHVSVRHAPFFESDKIDLAVQLTHLEDVEAIAKALNKTMKS